MTAKVIRNRFRDEYSRALAAIPNRDTENLYVEEAKKKFMVAEALNANTKKEDLLEEPYYKIRDFRLFEGAEAEIYAAYAEVDFYIYRNMALYAKRKYRYEVHGRHWDRYYKVLKFGKDKTP